MLIDEPVVIFTTTLTRLFAVTVYVLAGLFALRLPLRDLRPEAKLLAKFMWLAQLCVILLSMENRILSDFERWFWHLGVEWTLPSMLASLQLALVASFAIAASSANWKSGGGRCLYLFGIGLVFLFLATDELIQIHERIVNWQFYYGALGAVIAIATVPLLASSPRRAWHLCFLIGLFIGGGSAAILDLFRTVRVCAIGAFRFSRCLGETPFEETLEFLGVWLVLLAILGLYSESAPWRQPKAQRFLRALPVIWILLIILNHPIFNAIIPACARSSYVQFEGDMRLLSYNVAVAPDKVSVCLDTTTRQNIDRMMGYSVHLVDQVSGVSVASKDVYLSRRQKVSPRGIDHTPRYRRFIEVSAVQEAPRNRALWVLLTMWQRVDGAYDAVKAVSYDLAQLSDTQVVLGDFVLKAKSKVLPVALLANFGNGFMLEAFDMPERANAGETLEIAFAWYSDQNADTDYTQFLHLGHADSGEWFVYDQRPLGDRLPTRLWYAGMRDEETWQVTLPADLAPGRYEVSTGLYRASDLERIAATGADGAPLQDNRVPLGSLLVE